ncbi:transposase, partial [Escherichia coli]
ADRNRSHWSTSKTPSYTKSVSWQHHLKKQFLRKPYLQPISKTLI